MPGFRMAITAAAFAAVSCQHTVVEPALDDAPAPVAKADACCGGAGPPCPGTCGGAGRVYPGRVGAPTQPGGSPADEGWISLFDGETLEGWKASENPDSFSVQDGVIVADGPRSHLFYVGPVEEHDFRNFELRVDVMTRPGANSGIYFHTRYQERGWPSRGHEAQINNTQGDPRKTGSLYAVKDLAKSPVEDDVWFTYHVRVVGKRITLRVNGETTVDYTEPAASQGSLGRPGRGLSSGTIALQGHDPGSEVHFRNIMIRPLATPRP